MRLPNASRAGTFAVVLAISIVTLLFFSSVLRHGSRRAIGPPHTDMAQQFFPLRAFVYQQAMQGRLPMWNPHLAGGLPLHAEGQAGLLYPIGMALSFFPAALGINLYSWLHLALAGLALFFYLRLVGVSHAAAFLGALFFTFSSVPIARFYSGHYSMVPFIALVPGLMWTWEAHRQERCGAAAIGAFLYGLGVLAAHPQSLFYVSIYLGWHMAFDTVWDTRGWFRTSRNDRSAIRRVGFRPLIFGAALALGVGVGAVQLLPTLSFAGRSFRQETSLAFCSMFSLAPESLSTFLVPGFFGDMLRGPYWGRNYLWEMWGYVGIVPLALALAVALRPRGRNEWVHVTALPMFLILALGVHTPIFAFLYRWVPGFDMFRGSSKFLFYVVLSLAVLAARGTDRLLCISERDRTHLRVSGVLGLCVAAGAIALLVLGRDAAQTGSLWRRLIAWRVSLGEDYSGLFRDGGKAWPYATQAWALARWWVLRMLVFAGAGLALLLFWRRLRRIRGGWVALLLLAVVSVPDVYLFARGYLLSTEVDKLALPDTLRARISSDAAEPARIYSAGSTTGNALMTDGLDTVQGYVGLLPARSNAWLSAVSGYAASVDMASSPPSHSLTPSLFRANVEYLVTDANGWAPGETARLIAEAEGQRLYRVSGDYPRARFARQLQGAGSATEARAMLAGWMQSGEMSPPDIIEGAGAAVLPTVEPGEGAVHWIDRQPDRIVLKTNAPSSATLIVYEAWEAGWRCVIDRTREVPIYPANVMWRAVVVPEGAHRLEFVYRPPGLVLGATISTVSLYALLAIIAFCFLRDRSETHSETDDRPVNISQCPLRLPRQ